MDSGLRILPGFCGEEGTISPGMPYNELGNANFKSIERELAT